MPLGIARLTYAEGRVHEMQFPMSQCATYSDNIAHNAGLSVFELRAALTQVQAAEQQLYANATQGCTFCKGTRPGWCPWCQSPVKALPKLTLGLTALTESAAASRITLVQLVAVLKAEWKAEDAKRQARVLIRRAVSKHVEREEQQA